MSGNKSSNFVTKSDYMKKSMLIALSAVVLLGGCETKLKDRIIFHRIGPAHYLWVQTFHGICSACRLHFIHLMHKATGYGQDLSFDCSQTASFCQCSDIFHLLSLFS